MFLIRFSHFDYFMLVGIIAMYLPVFAYNPCSINLYDQSMRSVWLLSPEMSRLFRITGISLYLFMAHSNNLLLGYGNRDKTWHEKLSVIKHR